MKIYLKSLFEFDVKEAFGNGEIDLDTDKATLSSLLYELTGRNPSMDELLDRESGKISDEYFFTVNANEIQTTDGQEVILNDGDEVGIGYTNIFRLWGGG